MSEDAPRLSRKQMREQGLLKTVTEGTSPMEKLHMTQEIDLGRLSRKQMRELERQAAQQHEEAPVEAGPRRSVFERFDAENADVCAPADAISANSAASVSSPPSAASAPSAPSEAEPSSASDATDTAAPKPMMGNTGGVRWPGFGSASEAEEPAGEQSEAESDRRGETSDLASEPEAASAPVAEETAPQSSDVALEREESPVLSPYEVPAPTRSQRVSEELPRVEEEAALEAPRGSKSSRPRIVLMYVIGALVGLLLGIPVGLLLKNLLFSAAAGTVSTVLSAFGLTGGIPGLF